LLCSGNSYTSTVFDPRGIQPDLANPIGNPPFPGSTSCNGPNYIGFLTAKYNQSFVQTYNLAVGGATLDADIVKPFLPILDIRGQIGLEWFPVYSNKSLVPWTASNSLFSIFVGINDITNSYQLQDKTILAALLAEFSALLDQVRELGADSYLAADITSSFTRPARETFSCSTALRLTVLPEQFSRARHTNRLRRLTLSITTMD
jgi:hypothetical protein